MKVNPGGQLAPEDVIGRDQIITELLRILERQSVVLTAERRTGKTHLIRKLEAQGVKNWVFLYRDLESVSTTAEFAKTILADLYPYLDSGKQFKSWLDGLLENLGGTQVGPIKLPDIPEKDWKQILLDTLAHLSAHQSEKHIAFLWDELPMMLQKIDHQHAMEVLDTLRSVRQTYSNIRMIYTGSIGLHHVINELKEQGYTNAPINDMYRLELPPLQSPYNVVLARALMEGEGLEWDDDSTLQHISTRVDCVPFYIHHVIDRLRIRGKQPVTKNEVDAVIDAAITDNNDAWELKHYVDRVPTYYGKQASKPILALLDNLMRSEQPIAFGKIVNLVSGQFPGIDEECWRSWLDALIRDHYLRREPGGEYRYHFALIRQWWCWSRSL